MLDQPKLFIWEIIRKCEQNVISCTYIFNIYYGY